MRGKGFTLIELIIFVVILGITFSIVASFTTPLVGTHYIDEGTQALELAQQRMEIIINNPAIRLSPANLSRLVDLCPSNINVCNTSKIPGYYLNVTIENTCSNESQYINFNGSAVFNPATDCRLVHIYVYYTKNGYQLVNLTRGVTNHT